MDEASRLPVHPEGGKRWGGILGLERVAHLLARQDDGARRGDRAGRLRVVGQGVQPIPRLGVAHESARATGWTTYTDRVYGFTLQYPAGWRKDPRYADRYAGSDSFFAVAGPAASSDMQARGS